MESHNPAMFQSPPASHESIMGMVPFPSQGIHRQGVSRHCREGFHPFLREVRQVIEEATHGHMSQGAFFA